MRRDYDLPEEDTECLNSRNPLWETVIDVESKWLLIHNFQVPEGFNAKTAEAAVRITGDYLITGLDMMYFYPALVRKDGRHIPNVDATVTIKGKNYQQWSRHRTGANIWRPGIDNIITHLNYAEEWLLRELKR